MPINGIIYAVKERERRKLGDLDRNIEGIVLQEFERRVFDGVHSTYEGVISITCPENESHSGKRFSYIPLNNRIRLSLDQIRKLKEQEREEVEKEILSRFGYSEDKNDREKRLSIDNSVYEALKKHE